eukprot:2928195-Amphidinium_carterae.1
MFAVSSREGVVSKALSVTVRGESAGSKPLDLNALTAVSAVDGRYEGKTKVRIDVKEDACDKLRGCIRMSWQDEAAIRVSRWQGQGCLDCPVRHAYRGIAGSLLGVCFAQKPCGGGLVSTGIQTCFTVLR